MNAPAGEAILGAGYALFLLLAALGLDAMARHSHRRSGRYRTAGFSYQPDLDAWICPEGEHLHQVELDHASRIVRYRARAHICNACPAKSACTDSDHGREIVRPLDPWPHSEAGRFHRGIAVAMVVLGTLVAAIALVRNTAPGDLALLAPILGVTVAVAIRLGAALRRTASGFPTPSPLSPERTDL